MPTSRALVALLVLQFVAKSAVSQAISFEVEGNGSAYDVPHDIAPVVDADGSVVSMLDELALSTDASPDQCHTPSASAAKAGDKKKEKQKKEKQKKLKKAAASAYKPLFYDNDFSYLSDPSYRGHHFGDGLKQIGATCKKGCGAKCTSIGSCTCPGGSSCQPTLDIGGQYRFRFHSERNHRGLGLTGRDDQFLLHRTRIFANLRFGKRLRFYAEYLDATSEFERFSPRPIEENRSDMLNLFVDGVLFESELGKLTGRVGRQELLYCAQRTISPLDWANTRRTFDGGKLIWQTEKFQLDGFWVRPLRGNSRQFDNPNLGQQFYGVYSTYKDSAKGRLESYWLAFDNDATGFHSDSIGGRYYEELGNVMMEAWGNYQFGDDTDGTSHDAGAWTVGLGHKSTKGWKPTWWVYYDWASGSERSGAGDGYFQYFPLAHKYLGFMDLFGRRNIESPNVQFSVQPTKKLKLLAWYYYFFLEDQRDTPYSVAMTPFSPGVVPAGAELGQELDLMATYKTSDRSSLVLGYSHFFSGDYYDSTGVPHSSDADFFYTQYHVNF